MYKTLGSITSTANKQTKKLKIKSTIILTKHGMVHACNPSYLEG
jgi:hypothetical protein